MNQIEKQGIEAAKNSAIDNVIDLAKMLLWNKNHGIEVMRISSDLVPHATNPKLIEKFGKEGTEYANLEFLRSYLEKVGHVAKLEKMRTTFHPGQFVQIGSPTFSVYNSSVLELEMHVKFFEMMRVGKDSVIVIHIGGVFCDKSGTIERFKKQFKMMPKNIRDRIVLENDEKCYDADEVLEICESLNVPMVFDIFHYYCYKKLHPEIKQKTINEMMPRILETWNRRGIRPKFHLSEQDADKRIGSHAVFIEEIPEVLLEIPKKYNVMIDIMIEAKGKEIAIGKLYRKYPQLKPVFAKEIKLDIPKKALKDLNVGEPDDMAECQCEKN
jgi:UV DNA damage endonuclease